MRPAFTVVRKRMVLRNTGVGLELRVSRHVTTSNSMPLALALCRASKSRAARSTSRAVGAYLHQQSMPWASVRAFLGAWPSRRVPVRTVRCRARSVTKGQRYLGAGASSHYAACMRAHAHSEGYPFARSVTPSPRKTCNISTCAKRTACSRTTWRRNYCCHSMKHDQLAHTERICEQMGACGCVCGLG